MNTQENVNKSSSVPKNEGGAPRADSSLQGLAVKWLQTQGLPAQGLQTKGLQGQGLPTQGLQTKGLQGQGLPTQGLHTKDRHSNGLYTKGMGRMVSLMIMILIFCISVGVSAAGHEDSEKALIDKQVLTAKRKGSKGSKSEDVEEDLSFGSGETDAASDEEGDSSSEPRKKSPGVKKNCRIYVKNLILEASDVCYQRKRLKYTCANKEKAQFYSDDDALTIEKGKVVIPPNYAGIAHITVIIPESDDYTAVSTRIMVAVNKIDNPIEVNDMTEDYSEEERSIDLDAKARGLAELEYKSSDPKIRFEKGKAVIRRGFSGTATITATAKAAGIYKETSKAFKLTVLSGVAEQLYNEARSQIGTSGQGKNSTKYGSFTGMNRQAWCASFVSWCADNAGVYSLKPSARSVVPKTASTLSMCQYSTDYRVWSQDALEEMKRGDVIFFSRTEKRYQTGGSKSVCHVGIVEAVDASSNRVDVIEGNSTGDKVCRHSYRVDPATGQIRRRYFCGYISVH